MRKMIFIAVFTASGLVFVSCDTEAVESSVQQSKKLSIQKGVNNMVLREGDTLQVIDTTRTTDLTDGPGDDPIPVPPPPPKNP